MPEENRITFADAQPANGAEIRFTPCCRYPWKLGQFPHSDLGPIYWNPYNNVVQCHNCGAAFDERPKARP